MIYYKFDVVQALKDRGYNQTKIQREKLLPGGTIQNLKAGKSITLETLNKICCMLRMQPGDIVGVEISDAEKIRYF